MVWLGLALCTLNINPRITLPRCPIDPMTGTRLPRLTEALIAYLAKVFEAYPFGVSLHSLQDFIGRSQAINSIIIDITVKGLFQGNGTMCVGHVTPMTGAAVRCLKFERPVPGHLLMLVMRQLATPLRLHGCHGYQLVELDASPFYGITHHLTVQSVNVECRPRVRMQEVLFLAPAVPLYRILFVQGQRIHHRANVLCPEIYLPFPGILIEQRQVSWFRRLQRGLKVIDQYLDTG